MLNANFITRQLSFFSERIRGVKQCQASNLSRVATQWHGRELNPQPSSYKAELFPLSHGALVSFLAFFSYLPGSRSAAAPPSSPDLMTDTAL